MTVTAIDITEKKIAQKINVLCHSLNIHCAYMCDRQNYIYIIYISYFIYIYIYILYQAYLISIYVYIAYLLYVNMAKLLRTLLKDNK